MSTQRGDSIGSTLVVNIHHGQPYDIYIGRSGKGAASIWGNPYKMAPGESRESVIEQYRTYVLGRPDLMALIPSLKGKRLGCFCAPKACHGDVLAELADRSEEPTLGGADE